MEKSKKDIKRDILNRFKTSQEGGLILSGIWLRREYIDKLSSFEKAHFEKAVDELARTGLLEYNMTPFSSLRLTEKGANLLF